MKSELRREFKVYSDEDMLIIQEWVNFQEIKTLTPPYRQFVPRLPHYLTKDGRSISKDSEGKFFFIDNKKYYEK